MLTARSFIEKYDEGLGLQISLHASGWDDVDPEWGPLIPLIRWGLSQPLEMVNAYIDVYGTTEHRHYRDKTSDPVVGMSEQQVMRKMIQAVVDVKIYAKDAVDDEEYGRAFRTELLKLVLLVHWARPSLPDWVVDPTKARNYPRHPVQQAA